MTSSGTYLDFANFNVAQVCDEAYRRIQIDVSKNTTEFMFSARISLGLMFIDWANRGCHQFLTQTITHDLVVDDLIFTLDDGAIDVLNAVYTYNDQNIQIVPIGREDYLYINDPTSSGQPVSYYVDKTTIPPVVKLWPVPNIEGSQIIYNALYQAQDVGLPTNTPDITRMYIEAAIAGLCPKLAEKYSTPEMETRMLAKAEIAYNRAVDQDRDRAPYIMKPRLGRRYYSGV